MNKHIFVELNQCTVIHKLIKTDDPKAFVSVTNKQKEGKIITLVRYIIYNIWNCMIHFKLVDHNLDLEFQITCLKKSFMSLQTKEIT